MTYPVLPMERQDDAEAGGTDRKTQAGIEAVYAPSMQ